MSEAPPPFLAFLRRGSDGGGFGTDDVLAAMLPLFEQVAAAHQRGQVAPLDGLGSLLVEDAQLKIDPTQWRAPRKNPVRVEALQRPVVTALEVVGESRRMAEVDRGTLEQENLAIAEPGAEVVRPVYLAGYITWEHRVGHH